MIRAFLVKQIVSYEPPAYLLDESLVEIQRQGHKVIKVFETTTNNVPHHTNQAFLILYEECTVSDEELMKRVGDDNGRG